MKTADWIRALGVTALMASACGSTPAVGIAPSPSASPSASAAPTASPVAANPCPPPSNRCLALVTLRGSSQVVARDITDINHGKTVGTLGPIPAPVGFGPSLGGASGQFVSATELSYVGGPTDQNYSLPTSLFRTTSLSGSPRTTVVKGNQGVFVFAWNPSGTSVVYLTSNLTATTLHQLTAGRDRVLASLPAPGVGGCEVAPCPGPFQNPADNADFRVSYSPDGAFISVVQNGIKSFFWVGSAAGRVLKSSGSEVISMSAWSDGSLYFRDSTGVEVWRDGVTSKFLPGVAWIRPKASPGGGQIVYEARDAKGSAHVFVVDIASHKVRDLGKGRAEPVFLTSRYVWYEAEPTCVAAGKCEPSFPGTASGKTYIYDLVDGTEKESIITEVLDVWPHPA